MGRLVYLVKSEVKAWLVFCSYGKKILHKKKKGWHTCSFQLKPSFNKQQTHNTPSSPTQSLCRQTKTPSLTHQHSNTSLKTSTRALPNS